MRRKVNRWLGIAVILLGTSAFVWAEDVVEKDPGCGASNKTVITSEKLSFDYERSIAVFEDNVVVIDPEMRIKCKKLIVMFTDENDIRSITAYGKVRIWHEDKLATCRQAVYRSGAGDVVLTGNARLARGKDEVSGKKIRFWLVEDRVICEPGRLVIMSKTGESGEKDSTNIKDALKQRKNSSKKKSGKKSSKKTTSKAKQESNS